eukprot:gene23187-29382_t
MDSTSVGIATASETTTTNSNISDPLANQRKKRSKDQNPELLESSQSQTVNLLDYPFASQNELGANSTVQPDAGSHREQKQKQKQTGGLFTQDSVLGKRVSKPPDKYDGVGSTAAVTSVKATETVLSDDEETTVCVDSADEDQMQAAAAMEVGHQLRIHNKPIGKDGTSGRKISLVRQHQAELSHNSS